MEDGGRKWWLRPELEFTDHIDSWNVRASPSLDSEVVGVLKAGELFTALSVDGDWVQLQRNGAGTVGWSLRCFGKTEALAPAGHGASPVDSIPSPPPARRNSRAEMIGGLVAELGERRRELGGLAATEPSGSARVVRAASDVQATMAKLELHGVDQEALLGIEGHDALAEIDKVVDALCRDLVRTTSFQHSDFSNPEAESCWLSTFFQSLWHSRVFHSTFDSLVRPLPRAEGGTATNALRDTWELYEREAAQGNVVSVAALVEAWGHGYGDCAEAFGKLQSDPALAPLAAQFALVPVEFTGSTLPPAQLWASVLQTGASDKPLLALELMLPYVNNAAIFKLVRDVMPVSKSDADLGDDHRLVAMICFMESFAHYVVFCRRMSDPNRWLFFNDLPGTANGAQRELLGWAAVSHECGRFELRPKMLLYESPARAREAVSGASRRFWAELLAKLPRQRRGILKFIGGGGGVVWHAAVGCLIVVVIALIAQQAVEIQRLLRK